MITVQKTNEELARRLEAQDEELHQLREENMVWRNRWEKFDEDREAIITVPFTGRPQITLNGNWTKGHWRQTSMLLLREIRLQQIRVRKQIISEEGIKKENLVVIGPKDDSKDEKEKIPESVEHIPIYPAKK